MEDHINERWASQTDWFKKRLNVLIGYYGKNFFKNKRVLDLGCGHGFFGDSLAKLGAIVTYCDARDIHLDEILERNPGADVRKVDLDNDWPSGKWDLIIHFGVLYHLKNVRENLINACSSTTHMVLETEVTDSENAKCNTFGEDANSFGQSYNGIGSRPSPPYIERILSECNMIYQMLKTNACDSHIHKYAWKAGDYKERHPPGLRRMWFCRSIHD